MFIERVYKVDLIKLYFFKLLRMLIRWIQTVIRWLFYPKSLEIFLICAFFFYLPYTSPRHWPLPSWISIPPSWKAPASHLHPSISIYTSDPCLLPRVFWCFSSLILASLACCILSHSFIKWIFQWFTLKYQHCQAYVLCAHVCVCIPVIFANT